MVRFSSKSICCASLPMSPFIAPMSFSTSTILDADMENSDRALLLDRLWLVWCVLCAGDRERPPAGVLPGGLLADLERDGVRPPLMLRSETIVWRSLIVTNVISVSPTSSSVWYSSHGTVSSRDPGGFCERVLSSLYLPVGMVTEPRPRDRVLYSISS